MRQYIGLLHDIYHYGHDRPDRTQVGVRGLFGAQMRFDLSETFPLVTTKQVFWKGVVEELLWMLRGETNIRSLQAKGVRIWDEWADENGDLGPVYGAQWRHWLARDEQGFDGDAIDQIQRVLDTLKTDPFSRRMVVSAWNVAELHHMRLPPCHMLFQFYMDNGKLSCMMTQRSADMFLGVPFNIASYALLTCMIAHVSGLQPGEFIHSLGDAHIYHNHLDQVLEQINRQPKPLPSIRLNPDMKDLFAFTADDIKLIGYNPHPKIKGEVAV